MPPSQVREVLLSRSELLALRDLRGSSPLRITSDEVCAFCFDFGARNLAATTEEFVALSQNESDENPRHQAPVARWAGYSRWSPPL